MKLRRDSFWIYPPDFHLYGKVLPKSPPQRWDNLYRAGIRYEVLRAKVSWSENDWILHRMKVRPA